MSLFWGYGYGIESILLLPYPAITSLISRPHHDAFPTITSKSLLPLVTCTQKPFVVKRMPSKVYILPPMSVSGVPIGIGMGAAGANGLLALCKPMTALTVEFWPEGANILTVTSARLSVVLCRNWGH